jgi:hypothetical protein
LGFFCKIASLVVIFYPLGPKKKFFFFLHKNNPPPPPPNVFANTLNVKQCKQAVMKSPHNLFRVAAVLTTLS